MNGMKMEQISEKKKKQKRCGTYIITFYLLLLGVSD